MDEQGGDEIVLLLQHMPLADGHQRISVHGGKDRRDGFYRPQLGITSGRGAGERRAFCRRDKLGAAQEGEACRRGLPEQGTA